MPLIPIINTHTFPLSKFPPPSLTPSIYGHNSLLTLSPMPPSSLLLLLLLLNLNTLHCTKFTFINKCATPIWPATLTSAGIPPLNPTGFALQPAQTRSFHAPTGWSGRFWARTGCTLNSTSHVSCSTGDCGSGQIECNGAGAAPPATLAEFTLAGTTSAKDFYDVSLVDGYNLPLVVEPGSSGCGSTGCAVDLNRRCPAELRVGEGEGEACRSACEAFGKPEFCCSGAYGSPATCRPSIFSEMFKTACPQAYSYAYDDATSTFTCTGGGDYTVTFCPDSTPSEKPSSRKDPTSNYPPPKTTGVMLEDNSWLASLATGDAATHPIVTRPLLQQVSLLLVACNLLILKVF